MTTTETLKERSLELINSATGLEDVSYLVKSLADTKQLDSTILDALNSKVTELSPTSSAKEIAYVTKALESYTGVIDDKIYSIGIPGEIGFGVATCPPDLLPDGWVGLDGHDRIGSPNYGNYIDQNGSILVYVPKHYYKLVGNEIYIADNPTTDYVLHRCFINAGVEIHGLFIYKYIASNKSGIFASVRNADPLSTNSAHNPISALVNTPANTYGGLYTAVKSAGADYYLTSKFEWVMMAFLALAHGKAATSEAACAYIDVNPKFPKGCHVSALHDVNDASVTYSPSGYSDCGLTGSGTPFAKTTHNGQDCGIADLNGLMWEVVSGFTCLTASGADDATLASDDFLILKESVDIRAILDDSTTAGTGAYDIGLYDQIDLSGVVDGNDGSIYFGNGTEQVFAMNTDRTSADYRKTALGIPLSTGLSSSGTTEFGNDYLYRYLRNELACLCGGLWSNDSNAGLFALSLANSRPYSSSVVGARASYLV